MGAGNTEVVSIGIGGSRRPDYARLACGRVAAARQVLGLDLEDFAGWIRNETGWDMEPEAVGAWEDDVEPPGSVVYACQAVTQGLADPVSLLAGIPPAFPVEVLAGTWVTSYQFIHNGKPHHHADIAHVTTGPGNRIHAVNHPPEPRSEGRGHAFRNEIDAELTGRHVGGVWMNTSDTRYYGWFQLAVLPGEIVMRGGYYGVASDIEVSSGTWTWVRLDLGPVPPAGFTLRDPHELHDLVMGHSEYGAPLTLADVRGDSQC